MKLLDRLAHLTAWFFLLLAALLLLRPGGALRMELAQWREQQRQRHTVHERWPELSSSEAMLGAGTWRDRMVEFVDYQCFFCRAFQDTSKVLLRNHPQIGIVVRQLPHPGDRLSRSAALAAICATEQGRFQAMHDRLLADSTWMLAPDWQRTAAEAGVPDTVAFRDCRASTRSAAVLAADSAYAADLKLRGTPVLVTEHRGVHLGLASINTVRDWLRLEEHRGTP